MSKIEEEFETILTSLDFTSWNQTMSPVWMKDIFEIIATRLSVDKVIIDVCMAVMEWYGLCRVLQMPNAVFKQFATQNKDHLMFVKRKFKNLGSLFSDLSEKYDTTSAAWFENSTSIPVSDGFGQGIFGMTSSWIGCCLMVYILQKTSDVHSFNFIQTSDDVLLRVTLKGKLKRNFKKDSDHFSKWLSKQFESLTGMSLSLGKCVPTVESSTITMFNSKAYDVRSKTKRSEFFRHLKQYATPSELIDSFSSCQQIYDSFNLHSKDWRSFEGSNETVKMIPHALISSSLVQRGFTQFPQAYTALLKKWGGRYACALFGFIDFRGYPTPPSPAVFDLRLLMSSPKAFGNFCVLYPKNPQGRMRPARLKTIDKKTQLQVKVVLRLFQAETSDNPVSIANTIDILSKRMESDKVKKISTGEFVRQFHRAWIYHGGVRSSPCSEGLLSSTTISGEQVDIALDVDVYPKRFVCSQVVEQPLKTFQGSTKEILMTVSAFLSDREESKKIYGELMRTALEEGRAMIKNPRIFVSPEALEKVPNTMIPLSDICMNRADGKKIPMTLMEFISRKRMPCLWVVAQRKNGVGPGVMVFDKSSERRVVYVRDKTIIYYGKFERSEYRRPVYTPIKEMPPSCPGFEDIQENASAFHAFLGYIQYHGQFEDKILWTESPVATRSFTKARILSSEPCSKYNAEGSKDLQISKRETSKDEISQTVYTSVILSHESVDLSYMKTDWAAAIELEEEEGDLRECLSCVLEWHEKTFPGTSDTTEIGPLVQRVVASLIGTHSDLPLASQVLGVFSFKQRATSRATIQAVDQYLRENDDLACGYGDDFEEWED